MNGGVKNRRPHATARHEKTVAGAHMEPAFAAAQPQPEGDDRRRQPDRDSALRVQPQSVGRRRQTADQDLARVKPQSVGRAAAVCTIAFYVTLRTGIKAFHYARRHFLRTLLLDVCSALTALNVVHWCDFGSLLGLHRDGDLILVRVTGGSASTASH